MGLKKLVKKAAKSFKKLVTDPVDFLKDDVAKRGIDMASHPLKTLKQLDNDTLRFRKGSMSIKDSLLGETKDLLQDVGLAAPDAPKPGPVIPMVDEEAVRRAKKRGLSDSSRRQGRASTVLTGSGTLLG